MRDYGTFVPGVLIYTAVYDLLQTSHIHDSFEILLRDGIVSEIC